MRHPLLLQGSLAPLPEPPSAASEDTELSYLDSFAPGADVPSQAPGQAPADAGSQQVSHIFVSLLPAWRSSSAGDAVCLRLETVSTW